MRCVLPTDRSHCRCPCADIVPGTIAVPHGWGLKGTGRWPLANRVGGVNVNQLMSSDPNEALAGMSWLTGVPVEVERA